MFSERARRLYRRARAILLAVLLVILAVLVYQRVPARFRAAAIRLPDGFQLAVYADSVPGARSMALGPGGLLFVGTRGTGAVYAVVDADGDFRADGVHTIARDLHMPNGVAFRDGSLYVAEVTTILRFDRIEDRLTDPPVPEVIVADLPEEDWHGWRYLAFGPDGKLYVSLGVPCNVCLREDDERFGTIMRMDADGTNREIVARGVRNSVGFDWHPATDELWFTDNGRDWMGNDAPPDELNRLDAVGQHFGFPFCHGGTIPDPDFAGRDCAEFVAPVQALDPHVAALGMRFYRGDMFPAEYRGHVFIAEHGSWNRFPLSGYRVSVVRLADRRPVSYEPFATGWLRAGRASGTPADLVELVDGSLLVSDDRAGKIYRITYRRP